MKVLDRILEAKRSKTPTFSFEIVPPPRGRNIQEIIDVVEAIQPFKPAWIDVTSHASNIFYFEKPDGSITKRTLKKRPGTLGICGVIQNRFKIDTVAHILCKGFTKEETEDALIELNYLGIHNVLALQGDSPNYIKEKLKKEATNEYAADLVEQVVGLRSAKFIDDISNSMPLDFCVGVAGYPEKHFEAPNMKSDVLHLKEKVDRGADYIVSQMFFDNPKFHAFRSLCSSEGISAPVVPGLKLIRNAKQLSALAKSFHIDIPMELADEIRANEKHAEEIGVKWAKMQVNDLISAGVYNIHFYILNDAKQVVKVLKDFL